MRKQGNQKHLTFEQRVDIEKGLTENKSFAEIAKLIGKDLPLYPKRCGATLTKKNVRMQVIQIHPARTEKAAR